MARPFAYYDRDGNKLPSVTTILSKYKESGGLVHWAWDLGRRGLDYRDERDNAASAGKIAHSAVEAWARGEIPTFGDDPELARKARAAFDGFSEWAAQTHLQITKTEFPMISERHKYGGTPDALLVQQTRAMGDWKTGNAVYPEHLCQLAAYGELWNENYPDDKITGGYHLLRFDKEGDGFRHYWWPDLSEALQAFLLLRQLWDCDKVLKRMAQ